MKTLQVMVTVVLSISSSSFSLGAESPQNISSIFNIIKDDIENHCFEDAIQHIQGYIHGIRSDKNADHEYNIVRLSAFLSEINWNHLTLPYEESADARKAELHFVLALNLLENNISLSLETQKSIFESLTTCEFANLATKGLEHITTQKYVAYLISVYCHVNSQLDVQFNPNKLPSTNLSVPGHPEYPSGVDPSAIKDKNVKMEYEKALEKSHQYAEYYRKQTLLKRILTSYYDRMFLAFRLIASNKKDRGVLKAIMKKTKNKTICKMLKEALVPPRGDSM